MPRSSADEFWRTWAKDAQLILGTLLAETIGKTRSTDETIGGCVDQLIDVEQQLSAVVENLALECDPPHGCMHGSCVTHGQTFKQARGRTER